jgi:hypothetical protein
MSRPGFDWRDASVARSQALRDLDVIPWAPRPGIHWRALGWSIVAVVICSFLLGLMAVGS